MTYLTYKTITCFADACLKRYLTYCIAAFAKTFDFTVSQSTSLTISGVLTANLPKTVANLLASIKLQAYSPPLPIETDRIHVANGTFSRTAASVPTRATATTASPSLIIQTHPLRKSGCNSYRSCCKKMIFPPCRNFSATVCCPPPRGRRCSYSSARAARTKAALDWSCAPCWVTA